MMAKLYVLSFCQIRMDKLDITDLIKAEHILTNAESSKLIVQAQKDSREIALQKIQFLITKRSVFSNLINILKGIASNIRKVEKEYYFNLKAIEVKGNIYFDLSQHYVMRYGIYECPTQFKRDV